MEHSEIILKIIEDRGITPYRMAKDTGISNSLFTEWKRKPTSKIYSGNLVLIADYLNCSVDYLLGRTDDPLGGGPGAPRPGPAVPLPPAAKEPKRRLGAMPLRTPLRRSGNDL